MLALIGTLVWVLAAPVQQASDAWVVIQNASGRDVMGFRARQEPYSSEVKPAVTAGFSSSQPVKDSKGRVISAAAFYGWEVKDTIHVVALVLVPDEGAENRFYPDRQDQRLHYEEAARFELKRGESRGLNDLLDGRFKAARVETRSGR